MKIFIDREYKCHVTDDGTMREIETDFFDGKSTRFIEGYRFVPAGDSWTRSDGVVFHGEMIAPLKEYELLAAYQEAYEENEQAKAIREAMDVAQAENAQLKQAYSDLQAETDAMLVDYEYRLTLMELGLTEE